MTGYRQGKIAGVLFPTGGGGFSLRHVQAGVLCQECSYQMNLSRVPFRGVKRVVQESDHVFPTSVKVKNACGCPFIPPNVDITRVLKEHRPKSAFFYIFSHKRLIMKIACMI